MKFDVKQLGAYQPRTDRHKLGRLATVDGLPARRLVVVLDRLTLSSIAAKWSDPITGEWEIKGIPEYPARRLIVLGLDSTGNYDADVVDYVSQYA